jgi:hypothetical protein
MRVSLVGVDVMTVESHVVVASFDTFLHHAEPLANPRVVTTPVPLPVDGPPHPPPTAAAPEKRAPRRSHRRSSSRRSR